MEVGETSSNQINNENTSQTDESKVAEQQISARIQAASKPRVPCYADTGKITKLRFQVNILRF